MPALIGTHTIGYRDLEGTRPCASVAILAAVEFSERSYTHRKRFGTDQWLLAVGEAFAQLLRDATSKIGPNPSTRLAIRGLEVTEFRKGLFQWSRHSIKVRFRYELWRGKKPLKSGVIQEEAEGRGTEFGLLTFVPILGNMNFDKGIELALSRCLQKGLASLADQIEGA